MFNFLFTKTPLLFFVQSFWRDEAFTSILAKKNIFDLLILTAKDFNPPFYYLVIHFWMKLFGSSEISLRSISLIFFWLTIYYVYLFLTHVLKITSKRIWVYVLLVVLNPILLYYAFEARMYTMLAFLATLSFYSFIRKNYKGFFIATLLGLYTHYFMVFVLLAELIFYYVTQCKRFTKTFLLKYITPFFLFIPWALFVLKVKDFSSQEFWIDKSTLATFAQLFTSLYTGYDNSYQFYQKSITSLSLGATFLFICCLISVLKRKRIDKKLLLYFIFWSLGIPLVAVIISFVKPIFFPRYFIFSSVGLLILIIYLFEHLPSQIRTVIMVILIVTTLNFVSMQVKYRKKADLRRIFREMKYLAKPNDVVYLTNELDYFTAQYYFDENRVYVYGKRYEVIPDYVGKVLIPKSKFVSTLPIYPNKAFILTSDSHYEIQAAR